MARTVSPVPGSLKSVQRGSIALAGASSATATISAVNPLKTEMRLLGFNNPSGAAVTGESLPSVSLTNSTTVTARTAGLSSTTVVWELSEFY